MTGRPNVGLYSPFTKQKRAFLFLMLVCISVIWLLPIVWMVLSSFKNEKDIISLPLRWIPMEATLSNYKYVLLNSRLLRWILNSVFVSSCTTIATVAVCSLAAYSFARISYAGRDTIFLIVLASMLIPREVYIVPLYLLMRKLGVIDTYVVLMLPRITLPMAVFLLRQFFLGIPTDLEEAALIEGSGRIKSFVYLILPLSKPAIAAASVFTFVWSWNDFLWPLITISKDRMYTVVLGIANFQGVQKLEYGRMLAAAVIAALPLVVVFLILQKQFIRGVTMTGLKY